MSLSTDDSLKPIYHLKTYDLSTYLSIMLPMCIALTALQCIGNLTDEWVNALLAYETVLY